MHYVFALFDPWRFEIKEYPSSGGYNIEVMRGRFKSLLQLKSNEGEIAPRFGLQFDGLHEIFREMPLKTDKDALTRIYNKILLDERARVEKINGRLPL